MENRVSMLKETTPFYSRELQAVQLQVRALQDCAIDTENRLRCNNIHVLGLPERAEGSKPMEFAENILIT